MGYKRAEWHSGLTYQQPCRECGSIVTYKDDVLDFRPWYADGFVYCPKCRTPLRHNEQYAIDKPDGPTVVEAVVAPVAPVAQPVAESVAPVAETPAAPVAPATNAFCSQCGNRFNDGDKFCARCGAKRA